MSNKFRYLIRVITFSFIAGIGVSAQTSLPAAYTSSSGSYILILNSAGSESIKVKVDGSFTINSAGNDDTVKGTLLFSLNEENRLKIAGRMQGGSQSVPANITRSDVIGHFVKGASCPTIRLAIEPLDLKTGGIEGRTGRLIFEFHETRDQMAELFCVWTRQINARKSRRGVVAAINKLMLGSQQ